MTTISTKPNDWRAKKPKRAHPCGLPTSLPGSFIARWTVLVGHFSANLQADAHQQDHDQSSVGETAASQWPSTTEIMPAMIYSVGIWTAKPGHEDAFVAGWNAMAEWTLSRFPQAHGTLLRDRATPNRFVSFGPWPDEQMVSAWRADPAFDDHVVRMREHLTDFQPGTFDVVSEAGS